MPVQEKCDECQIAPACRCDQWCRTLGVSCFDIHSLLKQPFDLCRGSFGEDLVDRAIGMDDRRIRCGLRLIGTHVTEGRESEHEKEEGAGNAGAVVPFLLEEH